MRKFYKNTDFIRPYRAGSVFATLRIAGHHSKTLLTDFKNASGFSIEETLNDTLYSHNSTNGNLSTIPTPHLGLIIQGVISICKRPRNFHGHDLIEPLLEGFPQFKTYESFNNYFGYSLAVIALCNSGEEIPDDVIRELIKGSYRKGSNHSVDTNALILTALSCVSRSNSTLKNEVYRTKSNLAQGLISKQNTKTGAFGNQYSSALAVEVNIQIRKFQERRFPIYRVYKKKCPEYKIAFKLDICKITDTNSNQQLIKGLQVCISVNFVFICLIL